MIRLGNNRIQRMQKDNKEYMLNNMKLFKKDKQMNKKIERYDNI